MAIQNQGEQSATGKGLSGEFFIQIVTRLMALICGDFHRADSGWHRRC
jgi:hypothetical protein